jgi:hypothetical protein
MEMDPFQLLRITQISNRFLTHSTPHCVRTGQHVESALNHLQSLERKLIESVYSRIPSALINLNKDFSWRPKDLAAATRLPRV